MDTENPRPEALPQSPLPHARVEPGKTQSRKKTEDVPLRTCSGCKQSFPATAEYFFRKLTGLQSKCKTCAHVDSLAYQRAHKETINARHRATAAPLKAERQRVRALIRSAPEKACTKCRQMLPRTKEFFPINVYKYDGFEPRCRPCYRKRRWTIIPVDVQRQRQKVSNRRLKEQVVAAYGGCCTCCGERHLDFLTVEHTRRDGAAHRRAIGQKMMYHFLKQNGFPREGLTILCWNCNLASRDGDPCPHQETNPQTRNLPPRGLSAAAASNRRLRNETLEAYGHRCACCGEENARFLTIEHLVKTWTGKRPFYTQGAPLCRALKRQGFPKEGYTLLCFSCNCTSRYGNICPHKQP